LKIRLSIPLIFILFILTFISFSNFESEAKTIDVTIIDASSDFIRVMLDIYGYTPSDGRVSVKIENTGGQVIKQTYLNVIEKSDFVWGAQMSFMRTSSSGPSYNVFVYDENGKFLGSTSFSLTGAPSTPTPTTPTPTTPTPTTPTYRNTYLSLQIQDGSSTGYVQVYPKLTHSSGSKLGTTGISIYVDGNLKSEVSSNKWSSNIWAGDGSHTIRADFSEHSDASDSSITYGASTSNTYTFSVQSSIPPIITPPPSPPSPQPDDSFPIWLVAIAVVMVAAVGIGIKLSKRKKVAPVISAPPAKSQVIQSKDDTQFWVCPRCGGDIQMISGKQYCRSCSVYL